MKTCGRKENAIERIIGTGIRLLVSRKYIRSEKKKFANTIIGNGKEILNGEIL